MHKKLFEESPGILIFDAYVPRHVLTDMSPPIQQLLLCRPNCNT